MGVVVELEALRLPGRQVGIGLDGVAEFAGQRAAEPHERLPRTVQALQDQSRPCGDELANPAGMGEIRDRGLAHAGGLGVAGARQCRSRRG